VCDENFQLYSKLKPGPEYLKSFPKKFNERIQVFFSISEKKLRLSDYCYFSCLTQLLKNQEIADHFMERDQFQSYFFHQI
jgi:hypothetical protein